MSSSLTISSKVKPYWKPEQPPPCTNTRSLRSGLPSSSTSSLTLFAALSVKTSGGGGASASGSDDVFGDCAHATLLEGEHRDYRRTDCDRVGRISADAACSANDKKPPEGGLACDTSQARSALAELLAAARAVQADLLALDLARVAGDEAGPAQVAGFSAAS